MKTFLIALVVLFFCTERSAYSMPANDRQSYGAILDCNDPSDSLCLFEIGLHWYGIDYQKSYDTLKLYCETHPYAYTYPGQLIEAIKQAGMCVPMLSGNTENNWISYYNWLRSRYATNDADAYRRSVGRLLASAAIQFDRNLAANLFYNLSLLFPDSLNVDYCARAIEQVRVGQADRGEDTTVFSIIDFPPPPYGSSSVIGAEAIEKNLKINVNSNPSSGDIAVEIELARSSSLSVSIYDLLGRRHLELWNGLAVSVSKQFKIPSGALKPGVYFVKVEIDGRVCSRRFVIE